MFWNDLKEIKRQLDKITQRLDVLDRAIVQSKFWERESIKLDKEDLQEIKEFIADIFYTDDENSYFKQVHNKLDEILKIKKKK